MTDRAKQGTATAPHQVGGGVQAERPVEVAIYGAGQLGNGIAHILEGRPGMRVLGPGDRSQRRRLLGSGADVVVIATTSFLSDVANDIVEALRGGSNVICSAEEAAFPWESDPHRAQSIDALAREKGVTVMGCGLNPGFAFDAFVVTATAPTASVRSIRVERTVDLSGFGATVLRRLGIGFDEEAFRSGVAAHTIFGHIGFPQSMRVVAAAMGTTLQHVEPSIEPIIARASFADVAVPVLPGRTAGFHQRYVGFVDDRPWFEAGFHGHISPASAGLVPRDEIWVTGEPDLHYIIEPGLQPQSGSAAVIANSVLRVIRAPAGWQLTPDLPPARPPARPRRPSDPHD